MKLQLFPGCLSKDFYYDLTWQCIPTIGSQSSRIDRATNREQLFNYKFYGLSVFADARNIDFRPVRVLDLAAKGRSVIPN